MRILTSALVLFTPITGMTALPGREYYTRTYSVERRGSPADKQMRISTAGISIIKSSEGFIATPKRDHDGRLTIGFGHTRGVKANMKITQAQAEVFLMQDIAVAEAAVNRLVTVPLTQNEFDAICSWTYNLGDGALAHSSVLVHLNSGMFLLAGAEMLKYNHIHNTVIPGLTIRRAAEVALFFKPDEMHPAEMVHVKSSEM